MLSLPVILLFFVIAAIIVRKVGHIHLPIWLVMLIAAIIVLISGDISMVQAYDSIDFNVLFYLFGVFIIGQGLESSHYLEHLTLNVFNRAANLRILLLLMIMLFGFCSAFVMNDTMAIIGTPCVLLLARHHQVNSKIFLLTLAFAITIGSVMSPVGNPQNLLIAMSGLNNPVLTFLKYLFIPTLISLIFLFLLMSVYYRNELIKPISPMVSEKRVDSKLAGLSRISVGILIGLILLKIILDRLSLSYLSFSVIAILACLPILIFSERRISIFARIDWYTLVFFVGLFVFMKSVWLSQFFQDLLANTHLVLTHKATIFTLSILLSQLISNVPLVALYLPFIHHLGAAAHMALAAGSTLAGNLLILGAASNVIIIQNTQNRGVDSFTTGEFFKLGLPLTLGCVFIYYLFLR